MNIETLKNKLKNELIETLKKHGYKMNDEMLNVSINYIMEIDDYVNNIESYVIDTIQNYPNLICKIDDRTNVNITLPNLHDYPNLYNYYDYMSKCVIIPKNEMNDEIKNEIFKYMSIYNDIIFTSYNDDNNVVGDESYYSLIDFDTFQSYN